MRDPSSRLRVLILTQYYPPETGAPQARLSELAMHLREAGMEVQALTAMPNYPTGRVFDGYRRRLWLREEIARIEVLRTAVLPSRSAGFVMRLASYFSFVMSSAMIGPLLVRRPDIIIVESPPLFLGITAIFLKLLFRAKLVFNVSDLWPESAVFMGLVSEGSVAARLARGLERICYRSANLCSGQSPGICDAIRKIAPGAQVVSLPNGCDTTRFRREFRSDVFRVDAGRGRPLIVGYAGLLGLAQGVDIMVEAATRLRDRTDIQFVIVGDGPERERIASLAAERNLDNLTLYGHVPSAQMPGIVAAFDITVIPLRHSIPGALPSKTYEAMAAEVPVIMAAGGEGARLIADAEAGLVVKFEDLIGLVAAVEQLASDPAQRARLGAQGRRYVELHHDRAAVARGFAKSLITLAGRRA